MPRAAVWRAREIRAVVSRGVISPVASVMTRRMVACVVTSLVTAGAACAAFGAAAASTPVSSVAWDLATVDRISKGSAERGAKLHAACVACHGAEGIATAPGFPDLAGQDARYLYKQIVDFRTGARASALMKAYVETLSDGDAADLAMFYASRTRPASNIRPLPDASTMMLVRIGDGGRMIVACSNCHGERGSGNPGTYGMPALEGQKGDYLLQTLRAFQSGERRNDVYASMRNTVKRLSPQELAQLASYYSGTTVEPLPPAAPSTLAPAAAAPATPALPEAAADGWYLESQARAGATAYAAQCASCHGAALGGGVGPSLVGSQFWRRWAGKPFSAIFSEVHVRMPMQAPGSVAPDTSVDIIAFMLRRNGVAAGPRALTDRADLSRALPAR
jgi:cytochrome c553